MNLKSQLLQLEQFPLKNRVFYQAGVNKYPFASHYIRLREKEHRIYNDETLKGLPGINKNHVHYAEWSIRKNSLKKFILYLKEKSDSRFILELGCGNGWFSHHLSLLANTEVIAVDLNEQELIQGAKVFDSYKNLSFVYADIFTVEFALQFDVIVLAGAIQYFPDLKKLIHRLLQLLMENGEIHILDSPVYKDEEVEQARARSAQYFENAGAPEMREFYHHHSWSSLRDLNYKVRNKPFGILYQFERRFLNKSPFPWVIIAK